MSKQSRLTDTTLTVNASNVEIDAATSSAVNVYGDVSMNSRLFVAGNATASRLSVSGSTVASYSPTPISNFEQLTINGTWNGSTSSVTLYLTRINNLCTLLIHGGVNATGTNYYATSPSAIMPARFRPTRYVYFPIIVEANGSTSSAYTVIDSSGYIYSPIVSGVLNPNGTANMSGPSAGGGTFWTINYPPVSYYVA